MHGSNLYLAVAYIAHTNRELALRRDDKFLKLLLSD